MTEEEMVGSFARHLVALAVSWVDLDEDGQPEGEPTPWCSAGFVLDVGQPWWTYVTAGHILADVLDPVRSGRRQLVACRLVDIFGPPPIKPSTIPIDLANCVANYRYDPEAGIDVGVVFLSEYYVKLLKVNGVVPVRRAECIALETPMDVYLEVGLPDESMDLSITSGVGEVVGRVTTTLIRVNRLSEIPEDYKREYPRFAAKVSDDLPLASLSGMSGGPIFGMRTGDPRYWVVGIQSTWVRPERLTFGFGLAMLFDMIEAAMQSARA